MTGLVCAVSVTILFSSCYQLASCVLGGAENITGMRSCRSSEEKNAASLDLRDFSVKGAVLVLGLRGAVGSIG